VSPLVKLVPLGWRGLGPLGPGLRGRPRTRPPLAAPVDAPVVTTPLPDDIAGAIVCLVGVAVIMYAPRSA